MCSRPQRFHRWSPQKAFTIKKTQKSPDASRIGAFAFICFFFVYRISLPAWLYPSSIFGLLIGLREQ